MPDQKIPIRRDKNRHSIPSKESSSALSRSRTSISSFLTNFYPLSIALAEKQLWVSCSLKQRSAPKRSRKCLYACFKEAKRMNKLSFLTAPVLVLVTYIKPGAQHRLGIFSTEKIANVDRPNLIYY